MEELFCEQLLGNGHLNEEEEEFLCEELLGRWELEEMVAVVVFAEKLLGNDERFEEADEASFFDILYFSSMENKRCREASIYRNRATMASPFLGPEIESLCNLTREKMNSERERGFSLSLQLIVLLKWHDIIGRLFFRILEVLLYAPQIRN
ncbi:hypothetical protein V6N13_139296 [Hibiscus sabdariffa]|uniref:Uncharacterized protein n=1 Tax=Hibiscus sabdariffa TaxID=183260 RepID=A0ABR2C8I8_9ROSI